MMIFRLLVLQKGADSLYLDHIPMYLDKILNSLDEPKTLSQRNHYRHDKHNAVVETA